MELSGCAFETEFRRAYNWRDEKASVVFDSVVIGRLLKETTNKDIENCWITCGLHWDSGESKTTYPERVSHI